MPTLLDAMKKIKAKPAAVQSQQEGLQQVARKAQTGKATRGGGAKVSGLGEQRAIGQAATAGEQQAMQGAGILQGLQQKLGQQTQQQEFQGKALREQGQQARADLALTGQMERGKIQQGEELAGQRIQARSEQEILQINHTANQALDRMASERGVQQDRLFTQFERGADDLADRKDAAELHQAAFMYSFANKQYCDELNRIGQERRLNDQNVWTEECQQVIWGSELDQTIETLKTQETIAMTGQEIALQIKQSNIDLSIKIARQQTQQSAISNIIKGGGKVAEGASKWKGSSTEGGTSEGISSYSSNDRARAGESQESWSGFDTPGSSSSAGRTA